MNSKKIIINILIGLFIVAFIFSASMILLRDKKTHLVIFHAGSLSYPIEKLAEEYERQHPNIVIEHESAGSAASIRKITEEGRLADILFSSDYKLIDTMMVETQPKWANWSVVFARNAIVLAYTSKSQFSSEINASNWYLYANRSSVITTRSNPADDPCGYRTLITLKLASFFYNDSSLWNNYINHPTLKNPWTSNEAQLVGPLQIGEIDYAFLYESMALQYNLSYIKLDEHINLANQSFNDYYSKATVYFNSITGEVVNTTGPGITEKTGKAIWYGLTIPNNAPNFQEAVDFVSFILSEEGLRIISEQAYQPVINPPQTKNISLLPEKLKDKVIANVEL
ncbi:MAG: extracellular solute-binding protein [Candidatus Heimdallarchaeum aukensis]|uniref:Extracellular solute-binding protein n=1 Tax=Candidatus Heimdallarchaeum aukensis TaxID=2876573 RepID=A0A9Y1FKT0_9ARCH|nr:MAG: extracellular solute-binding protein [Candidatus Heimdallarchaeum aukensis]